MMDQSFITKFQKLLDGDADFLREHCKEQRRSLEPPFELALATLLSISGGTREALGYWEIETRMLAAARITFKSIYEQTAVELLKYHPEIELYLGSIDWIPKKIRKGGPLRRMDEERLIPFLLSRVLYDSSVTFEFQRDGLFDWDIDGVYIASLSIAYGWTRVLNDKLRYTQGALLQNNYANRIIRTALRAKPESLAIRIVKERFKNSWYFLDEAEQCLSFYFYSQHLKGKNEAWAASSLIDIGIRYADIPSIEKGLDSFQKVGLKFDGGAESVLAVANAWKYFHKGNKEKAQQEIQRPGINQKHIEVLKYKLTQ